MESFQSFDFVGNKDLNKKMFGNFAYDANNLPTPQQDSNQYKEKNMSKGMGGADWAQVGIGAFNSLAQIGLGAWQTKIGEDERQAKEKQRQIENERYNQQKAYHEKGITDAANTASGLKSASANVSSPQQNTAQTANNPPSEQNAQAQNPPPANTPQEDLPMQRQ